MKRVCWLILTIALVLICAVALAETKTGAYGGGTWTLTDAGVLTFSGSADLTDWDSNGNEFQNAITKVIYGPDVSIIEPGMHSYCYNCTEFVVDQNNPDYCSIDGVVYTKDKKQLIEAPTGKQGSLTLPENVITICHDAFIGSYLTELILPESLETIEYQAFWGAEFKRLRIPAATVNIPASALNLYEIEAFAVDEKNPQFSVKNGVLFNKDQTELIHFTTGDTATEYTVPQSVETIGYNSFSFANNLQSLKIQEGVTKIGSYAFNYCRSLNEIFLPVSLQVVENGVFRSTYNLKTVHYAGTVEQWKEVQVKSENQELLRCVILCKDGNCEPEPEEGTIGDGITYVLDYQTGNLAVSGGGVWRSWAFQENQSVLSAVLNAGVTEVGHGAFAHCRNLEEVTIPNSVTKICYEGFYYCESLTTINIPASVTVLENEVFDSCSSLDEIQYGGTKAQWATLIEGTENNDLEKIDIKCSDGTIEGTGWSSGGGGYYYEPGIQFYNNTSERYYMNDSLPFGYAENGLFMNNELIRFEIWPEDDTQSYWDRDPEGPKWTLSQTSGTAVAEMNLEDFPWYNGTYGSLVLTELPNEEETDVWHVTCTWAGKKWEKDYKRVFKYAASLPTGVEYTGGDKWILTVGDRLDLNLFLFKNNWCLGGEFVNHTLSGGGPNFWDAVGDEFDETTNNSYLVAKKPGTYNCIIGLECANLTWQFQTTLYISDENGKIPDEKPHLDISSNGTELYVYILPNEKPTELHYIGNAAITSFSIYNTSDFIKQINQGKKPKWNVELLSGTKRWKVNTSDGGTDIRLEMTNMPTKEETAKIKVSCSWGGATWEQTCTIHYTKLPTVPTGIDSPVADGRWTVGLEEQNHLDELFSFQNGWSVPNATGNPLQTVVMTNSEEFWENAEFDDYGTSFAMKKPGIYPLSVMVTQANIGWTEKLHLVVLNEDGTFPAYAYGYVSQAKTILKLPAGLSEITESSFEGVTAERIEIQDGCEAIQENAFANVTNLKEIVIPGSVTFIDPNAFSSLEGVVIISDSEAVREMILDLNQGGIIAIDH